MLLFIPFILFFFAILYSLAWATQLVQYTIVAGMRQQACKLSGFYAFMASLLWTIFYWYVS